ncbi:MAG: DUF5979 domain-containing protein [Actinomycetaceae bacterium]|nr:DUF5979 domain-containing protein [Actinomycetaceae bacterium]
MRTRMADTADSGIENRQSTSKRPFSKLSWRVSSLRATVFVVLAALVMVPLTIPVLPTAQAQELETEAPALALASAPTDPPSITRCGTSSAILIDSGWHLAYLNMSFTAFDIEDLKDFILLPGLDELSRKDTSAKVGLYTYDKVTPANSGTGYNLREESVSSPAVSDWIKSLTKGLTPERNMQAGLLAILADIQEGLASYDQVFIFTEWAPTARVLEDGSVDVGHRDLSMEHEELVATRNAVDQLAAKGVQVIPVGIQQYFDASTPGGDIAGAGIRDGKYYAKSPKDPAVGKVDDYGFPVRRGPDYQKDLTANDYYLTGPNLLKELATDHQTYFALEDENLPYIRTADGSLTNIKFNLADFLSPCLSTSVNVIDHEGKLVERTGGREVTVDADATGILSPQTLRTDITDGYAHSSIPGALTAGQGEFTYTRQAPNELAAGGQCYMRESGSSTWTKIEATFSSEEQADGTVTEKATFDRSPDTSYHCAFLVRETTELSITKDLTSSDAINNEVNSEAFGQFHFAYQCTDDSVLDADGKPFEVSGVISPAFEAGSELDTDLSVDLPFTLPERVPVGAECTVTEVEPPVREGYFSVTTSWKLNGAEIKGSTTADLPEDASFQKIVDGVLVDYSPTATGENPTVTFRAEPAVRGDITTLLATNAYQSPTVEQRVSITIDNPEVFSGGNTSLAPSSVWVKYTCRYIPDASNRPEVSDHPDQFPVFVPTGGDNPVEVPLSESNGKLIGEASLGTFPVGTQCGYEIVGEPIDKDRSKPIVDGYSHAAPVWSSKACMKNTDPNDPEDVQPGYTTTARECPANYSYAYPEVQENSEALVMGASLSFARNQKTLNITKVLEGAAQGDFVGQSFPATLTCTHATDDAWVLKGPESITLNSAHAIEREVAVNSTCVIQETTPEGFDSGRYDFTVPAPTRVSIDADTTQPATAKVTNTVNDKYGLVTVNYFVNTAAVTNLDPALNNLEAQLSAHCTLPDGEHVSLEATRTPGSFTVYPNDGYSSRYDASKGLPAGSICAFGITAEDLANYGVQQKAGTSNPYTEYKVVGGSRQIDLPLVLENPTTTLEIAFQRTALQVPDASTYLPNKYDVTYNCRLPAPSSTVLADTVSIPADGSESIILDVENGTYCSIEVKEGNSDKHYTEVFTRKVGFETGPPANIVLPGTDTTNGGSEFKGYINVEDHSAYLQAVFTYKPITADLNLYKNLTATVDDTTPLAADSNIYKAVFGSDAPGFTSKVVCTRNGKTVLDTGVTFSSRTHGSTQVPAGSSCTITEVARNFGAAENGPVSMQVGSTTTQGNSAVFNVPTGTAQPLIEATASNAYNILTGSLNVKKKVDGSGVATVPANKQFPVHWTCTLNGVTVSEGNMEMGRFTNATDRVVSGLPKGTKCTFSEDPAKVQDPESANPEAQGEAYYSLWSVRWNATEDEAGFGTEVACDNTTLCSSGTQAHEASFNVSKAGFNSTVVLWNTYDYLMVPVSVKKTLSGQGKTLQNKGHLTTPARGKLVCTHPAYADLSEGHSYIPNPTREADVVFPVEGGPAQLTWSDPSAQFGATTASEPGPITTTTMQVPANFKCTFVEDEPQSTFKVPGTTLTVKSTVTTSFTMKTQDNGTAVEPPAVSATPGDAPRSAKFDIDTSLVKNATDPGYEQTDLQTLVVDNSYQLDTAEITADYNKMTGQLGDVTPWLANEANKLSPTAVCTDPLLGTTSNHDVELTAGEAAKPLATVTVGSSCVITPNAKALTGGQEFVQVTGSVNHTRNGQPVNTSALAPVTIQTVAPGTENVSIQAAFTVPQIEPSVSKTFEGYQADTLVQDTDEFTFSYQCTFYNLVTGQPEPFAPNGEFTLSRNESTHQLGAMPAASSCIIKEQAFPQAVQDRLKAANVKMVPFYTSLTDEDVEVTHAIGTAGVTLNADLPKVEITNGIYRTDAELQVQKVQADLKTALGGSEFAIYNVAADGTVGSKVADMTTVAGTAGDVADATHSVRLHPGSYYLVETKSAPGAALLPGAWKFDVVVPDTQSNLADLQISIKGRTENSGLITLVEANPEIGKPAIVQVANVLQGKLPMSGGKGLLPWILGGLLLATAALWINRRSI